MGKAKAGFRDGGRYRKDADADLTRKNAANREGRKLEPIPPPGKPRVRASTRKNFTKFCLTYLKEDFCIPFSDDHRKAIAKIEKAVLEGGLFAFAMPRGSGKTTLCEAACLWALLHGHRSFVVLIGSDEDAAQRSLESIKVAIETNDLLLRDFPEVCQPVVALDRIAHRCRGQLDSDGDPTYIVWGSDTLVLPSIKGSKASGSVIKALGLTASIRGLKHKRPDGTSIRPDLVIPDDPQTDESSRSPSQCQQRERLLSGAVLGLAGPGKKISGVMPCTVITIGDMVDRLLNPKLHPRWNGERFKLLYQEPKNAHLWERYAELRADSFRAHGDGRDATEFYRQNREAMDEGALVAWPERKHDDELSPVQHAMNLKIDSPAAFAAEYQNDPLPESAEDALALSPEGVMARVNRLPRLLVPSWASAVTAFIDVQQSVLYYAVCAWGEGMTGAAIDYGPFPDQRKAYFTLRQVQRTLQEETAIGSVEGAVYAGLERLAGQILSREYPREGGGGARVGWLGVDAGWGMATAVCYRWVKESKWAQTLHACKGVGISAAANPMGEWLRREGERRGDNWVRQPAQPGRPPLLLYDTNHWKSALAFRLSVPMGEKGGLTLWGDRPDAHRMLADHLCSEARVRTQGRGRELDEWRPKPHKPDNHYLDCLTGCLAGASFLGLSPAGAGVSQPERKRVSWAELQRKKQQERGA